MLNPVENSSLVCQRRTPIYVSLMRTVCALMMTMHGVAATCMGKHAVLPPVSAHRRTHWTGA